MRRKRTGIILIVIGILLALGAGVLVFTTVQSALAQKPEPQVEVLFAAQDIPERTRITEAMIKVQKVNESAAPPNAVKNRQEIVDYVTVAPIFANQPFNARAIVTTTRETSVPSSALEKGKVLVAVNFSGAGNIMTAGAIRKGDTVDLIVKVPGPSGTVIATTVQNIKIYEIGSVQPAKAASGDSAAAPASTSSTVFIFQVTPEEALELKFLESLSPDILLRSAFDQGEGPQKRQMMDMEFIANKYGLPLARTAAVPGAGVAPTAAPTSTTPSRPVTPTVTAPGGTPPGGRP